MSEESMVIHKTAAVGPSEFLPPKVDAEDIIQSIRENAARQSTEAAGFDPDLYMKTTEEEAVFVDDGPSIGQAPAGQHQEFDISWLNRKQRKQLMKQFKLKLIRPQEEKVVDVKAEVRRRRTQRKRLRALRH